MVCAALMAAAFRMRARQRSRDPPAAIFIFSWALLACVVCCAAPPPPAPHAAAVVTAVAEVPRGPRDAVVQRLFAAAHGLLDTGDAAAALRVLALCGRLDKGHADLELAAAEIRCRTGDLAGALAGFRLASALARRRCPDYAAPSDRCSCSENDLRDALGLMVSASARHGMCLMEARRFSDAAARFRDALALDSVSPSPVSPPVVDNAASGSKQPERGRRDANEGRGGREWGASTRGDRHRKEWATRRGHVELCKVVHGQGWRMRVRVSKMQRCSQLTHNACRENNRSDL